jgi:ribosome modulation factor
MLTDNAYDEMVKLLNKPSRYTWLGYCACCLGKELEENPYRRFYETHPSRVQWANGWRKAYQEGRFGVPTTLDDL